jgi:hypothetical protein
MALNNDAVVIIKYLHVTCVRNYAIRKAIQDNFSEIEHSNFWRVVANSTLDTAVIDWCKLFGSHAESTHFSKCAERGIADFENQVSATTNISKEEYRLLHADFVTYRNKSAAHIDIDEWLVIVPNFHNAIELTYKSFEIFAANVGIKDLDLRKEYEEQYALTMTAINAFVA